MAVGEGPSQRQAHPQTRDAGAVLGPQLEASFARELGPPTCPPPQRMYPRSARQGSQPGPSSGSHTWEPREHLCYCPFLTLLSTAKTHLLPPALFFQN